MFDLDHPFFRPLWIRIVVTATCFGWALVETVNSAWPWAILFAALGVYCAWRFFVTFEPRDEP